MTKEELLAKGAELAAAFVAQVFTPEGSTDLGHVADDQNLVTLGSIPETGRYFVHSVSDAKSRTKGDRPQDVNSIRWNLLSEDGAPCAIYNGSLTRGPALSSAAKAGLLGTYKNSKDKLEGKFLNVKKIRYEKDADGRKSVVELTYTVED